jgi:hypothetical protein
MQSNCRVRKATWQPHGLVLNCRNSSLKVKITNTEVENFQDFIVLSRVTDLAVLLYDTGLSFMRVCV